MHSAKYESLTVQTDLDFPEYECPPPAPMTLVRRWFDRATESGVREPRALALATADARGRASTRIVAFSALNEHGLVFTSHRSSQKSRDIEATGWASGVLYWRETGQQVMLSGPVRLLGDAESDVLWNSRPVPLHAMTTVSVQSATLVDVEELRTAARDLERLGVPLPRPARFVGYRLDVAAVEFWASSSDRLHRRLRYDLGADGWTIRRLQP
jgi:pyridoxamine 5'-phosphate oxidase